MLIHATMKLKKRAAACPPLAGRTFIVYDGYMPGQRSGTVRINADLSYTVDIGGNRASGQLTAVNAREYTYHEDGPPVVDGRLRCAAGQWFFEDTAPGTASGYLAIPQD